MNRVSGANVPTFYKSTDSNQKKEPLPPRLKLGGTSNGKSVDSDNEDEEVHVILYNKDLTVDSYKIKDGQVTPGSIPSGSMLLGGHWFKERIEGSPYGQFFNRFNPNTHHLARTDSRTDSRNGSKTPQNSPPKIP